MDTILDRLLILCCCSLMLIFFSYNISTVVCVFLAAVLLTCIGLFIDKQIIAGIIAIIYLLGCCFVPEGVIFIPLFSYSLFEAKNKWIYIIGGILYLYLTFSQEPMQIIIMFVFTLLSFILYYKTIRLAELKQEMFRLKDTSRELEIMIDEKQKNYILQQDSEIRVATLRERNRIAREIHDNVGHTLTRAILMLGAVNATNTEDNLKEPLTVLKDTLTDAMNNIRESVHDLHDESIDLKENINVIIKEYNFCPVILDYDMSDNVKREVKYAFLSIIKEAMSNTAKHSNATKIEILVREHPGIYQLMITDNGSDMNAEGDRNDDGNRNARENDGAIRNEKNHDGNDGAIRNDSGIGLENMKERVQALNGTINISQKDGFRIFVSVRR